jgi:hypothetical protein
MTTKDLIRDEARRRVARALGTGYGADIGLAELEVVFSWMLKPHNGHRQTAHNVLQIIASARNLSNSLPDDYQDDRHWPHSLVVPAVIPDPSRPAAMGHQDSDGGSFDEVKSLLIDVVSNLNALRIKVEDHDAIMTALKTIAAEKAQVAA